MQVQRLRSIAFGWLHRVRLALGIRRPRDFERLETAIALLLDDDAAHNNMRKLQINILKNVGANDGLTAPPHITLKLGFKTSDLVGLSNYLDNLAMTLKPMAVNLKDFGSFDSDGYIFVGISKNIDIEALRKRILSDVEIRFGARPYSIEGDEFHLHATLAYGLPRNSFSLEYDRLREQNFALHSTIKTIALLCWVNNYWVVYKKATIGTQ